LNFNIYNSIILAGIIQGIIFGIAVLSSKKYKSKGIYFLTTLIIGKTLDNLQFLLVDIGLIDYDFLYNYFFFPWSTLLPILMLMYGKSVLKFNLNRSALFLLLTPFIFFFTYYSIIKIIMIFNLDETFFFGVFWYIESAEEIINILMSIAVMIFLLKKIHTTEKEEYSSSIIKEQTSWLKKILYIFLILTFIWAHASYRSIAFEKDILSYYYIIWIGMTFMIYWLGHIGIYKYGITKERKKIRSHTNNYTRDYSPLIYVNNHIKDLEELLIKKQLFLNPTLTLTEVAKKLDVSKSHLSRIINSELDTSFTDYLNSLRVEQVKQYIENESFTNYTLVAIGLEAGFNSKSTFNKAFKKNTGLTPSEYKKKKMLN